MAEPPFREVRSAAVPGERVGSDKSEFEDKVSQDTGVFKDRLDLIVGKLQNPKPEKDEGADKYAADWAKTHKHEKLEKDRNDIFFDVGWGTLTPSTNRQPVQDPQLLARVAALEAEIGKLKHFISPEQRPDLSKGALRDEPGAV